MNPNIDFPQMYDAFPDFDQESLPAIPPTWTDVSFANDACPCFEANDTYVFIDYPASWQREHPDNYRFTVFTADAQSNIEDVLLETDDWSEVIAQVNKG